MTSKQMEIMENKTPLPDMEWLIKKILRFIQSPKIDRLLDFNTSYIWKEIVGNSSLDSTL